MRKTLRPTADMLAPARNEVLEAQGVPPGSVPSERLDALFREALALYLRLAAPAAMFEEVAHREFAAVFEGEGRNKPEAPLASIFPSASRLALFAATIGEEIGCAVASLFESGDPALASMLDSIASVAADRASVRLEERFARHLAASGETVRGARTLAYSPGYCGWDISGQARLFGRLKPEAIGIVLGAGYLMRPIKSVSGVLVSGPAEIHRFEPAYPFCGGCRARACLSRLEEPWRS